MPTDAVFKFIAFRPPQQVDRTALAIRFATELSDRTTGLRASLQAIAANPAAADDPRSLARRHIASAGYVASPAVRVQNFGLLEAMAQAVAQARLQATPGAAAVAAIRTLFADDTGAFLASNTVGALEDSLWDGLYATTIAHRERPHDRQAIIQALRHLHLLRAVAALPDSATTLSAPLDDYLNARLVLPAGLLPGAMGSPTGSPDVLPTGQAEPPDKTLTDTLQPLFAAMADLRMHAGEHQDETVDRAMRRMAAMRPAILPERPSLLARWGWRTPESAARSQVKPAGERETLLRLGAERAGRLAPGTRARIAGVGLSAANSSVIALLQALEEQVRLTTRRYIAGQPRAIAYQLGGVYVPGTVTQGTPPFGGKPGQPGALPQGRIRNRGIADLMVVEQTLLRYEVGEIAHVENVMQGETRHRSHRRLSRTEMEVITETDRSEDSERDLQTTERFEMQRETQQTIKSDASVKAGITVSGGFGPVQTTAYSDFSLQVSQSESNRSSTGYAKDISDRSVARIMERNREQRTRRTLEEFRERNDHGFDNAAGPAHLRGVYRWVNKVYRAQVVNYGRRLMLEFIVPEPAAFYRYAEQNGAVEGVTLTPPAHPQVVVQLPGGQSVAQELTTPDQLDRTNYVWPAGQYNVDDIAPPPPERTVIAVALEIPNTSGALVAKASSELQVPVGYVAVTAEFHAGWAASPLYIQIGNNWTYSSDGVFALDAEDRTVPLSMMTGATPLVLNVEVVCQLRGETLAQWRMDTFNAIMAAHAKREAAYREQVAAALIRQSVTILGRNPARNRQIESAELKKACIRIMSGQDFTSFNAMGPGGAPPAYPEFDVAESIAEGRIIQFFEQAFEWEELTYLFYPYFWARKDSWLALHPIEDTDPLFTQFLQAGAARVLVPVRPQFNDTVLHYLSAPVAPDDPWSGGDAPIINDPHYLSLADELRAFTGGAADGVPVDEPWEIRVPTNLVYLQDDAALPDFATLLP